MKLDLFSKGDSVLLLGEGNFSFSVCLHKHRLPIQIVSTCFESKLGLEDQQKNIEYLKLNQVPVFLNVDATKLHENANLFNFKYSKIIFNFPHIGGKMKIHLNRELIRKVFESCSRVIAENGVMMVSLCRGQGGTPADKPQRKWDDSWQITEMAAYGDFVLTHVEPFLYENFPEYRCVGYRGQDKKFHLEGALVHIFAKREPPYPCTSESEVVRRLGLIPLIQNSKVFAPVIYADLYKNNPLRWTDSCISWFRRFLIENFGETSSDLNWKHLGDEEIPVYVENGKGVSCVVDSEESALRFCPFEVLQNIVDYDFSKCIILFPGVFFRPLSSNFTKSAPLEFRFIIVGELFKKMEFFLEKLMDLFQSNVKLSQKHSPKGFYKSYLVNSMVEILVENISIAVLCELKHQNINVEVGILNAQIICQYFFKLGWRDIWADETKVVIDGKPIFIPSVLYPSTYKFDITLRYNKVYAEEQFFKILWLAAGHLIIGVEIVNEYTSPKSWSSKCYRITYRSLDKPLYKNRVIEIHSKIVGRALELGLNVTIS